jgi:hypothetical protein
MMPHPANKRAQAIDPEFVPNSNEEQVNLEHVLPKRASAAAWGRDCNADEPRDYVQGLGNLSCSRRAPTD